MSSTSAKTAKLKQELMKLVQSGKYKHAEKLYSRVRGKQIEDIDIWKLFANTFVQRSNFEHLAECCHQILAITPSDVQTRLNYGAVLQNLGRHDQAIEEYQKCLELNPAYEQAHINCASLYYSTGRVRESLPHFEQISSASMNAEISLNYAHALIETEDTSKAMLAINRVLASQPENIKALFLSAQCHYVREEYAEAESGYQHVLKLDAGNIKAMNNLGRLYDETGHLARAAELYRNALALDDSIQIIHLNLGKTLLQHHDLEDARSALNKAVELDPGHPEAYFLLGKLYMLKEDKEKSREYFDLAMSKDVHERMEKPEEFLFAVKYFARSLDKPEHYGQDMQEYIANLFDGYADKFEEHLVGALKYSTPECIRDLLNKHLEREDCQTIDLGCGTGLCCKYLRPYSSHIIGVDLSPKMVDKAATQNCYDEVRVGEVTEALNSIDKQFDLICAADVFVYIGSLDEVFEASSKHITDDGLFIFSTEMLQSDDVEDYKIFDSGRHKHKLDYLITLSSNHNFHVVDTVEMTHRMENGVDVVGHVVLLQKMSS